jgi:hypothetical protein
MPGNDLGPPEKEVGPNASQGAGANQQISHDTTNTVNDNRSCCAHPYNVLAFNTRRFVASRRMAPIPPCGCVRDPDVDRHRCDGEISERMAEAAVAAAMHLDQLGTPALLDEQTCRAMWRIGYRNLAEAVHRRTAGAR